MSDLDRMIRPWFRGDDASTTGLSGDHIFADCEWLAEEGDPREGVGWLDPYGFDVCKECLSRYDPEVHEERENDE